MSSRRNALNVHQIHLLKVVYKFRFVTESLLARYKGVSRASVNYALAILRDQGLIDRRFERSYKLAGKSASYYLTSKAIRVLQTHLELNDRSRNATYRNAAVSDAFIDEQLASMAVYLALRDSYPEHFNAFTGTESNAFTDLPADKPGLYLSRRERSKQLTNNYVLDIISDPRLFVVKRRIMTYIEHSESGQWGKDDYPTVLLVLPSSKAENAAQRYAEPLLEDFDIYTTTIQALLDSTTTGPAIWHDAFERDELLSL